MNNINITITGIAGAGKTRLAHKIALMLEAENVSATIYDEGSARHTNKDIAGVNLPLHVKITVKAA